MNTIQDQIKKLNSLKFYPIRGGNIMSVTDVVDRFKPEFEADVIAKRVAAKQGKTVAAVRKEWAEKGNVSRAIGTQTHEYIRGILLGEPPDDIEALTEKVDPMRQFDRFWRKAGDQFVSVWVEQSVSSLTYGLTGTVDSLLHSSTTGQIHIVDWKTGGFSTKGWDQLFEPFTDLKSTPLIMGSIQTSLYRLLIEETAGIELGVSYLIFLGDHTYTVKACSDYRSRLKPWLKNRAHTVDWEVSEEWKTN